MVFAAVVSFSLGILAALYRDSWVDQVIRLISVAAVATPSFWLGILLIQWFSLELDWLPSGGFVPFSESPMEYINSMILSALAVPVSCVINSCWCVRTMVEAKLG